MQDGIGLQSLKRSRAPPPEMSRPAQFGQPSPDAIAGQSPPATPRLLQLQRQPQGCSCRSQAPTDARRLHLPAPTNEPKPLTGATASPPACSLAGRLSRRCCSRARASGGDYATQGQRREGGRAAAARGCALRDGEDAQWDSIRPGSATSTASSRVCLTSTRGCRPTSSSTNRRPRRWDRSCTAPSSDPPAARGGDVRQPRPPAAAPELAVAAPAAAAVAVPEPAPPSWTLRCLSSQAAGYLARREPPRSSSRRRAQTSSRAQAVACTSPISSPSRADRRRGQPECARGRHRLRRPRSRPFPAEATASRCTADPADTELTARTQPYATAGAAPGRSWRRASRRSPPTRRVSAPRPPRAARSRGASPQEQPTGAALFDKRADFVNEAAVAVQPMDWLRG